MQSLPTFRLFKLLSIGVLLQSTYLFSNPLDSLKKLTHSAVDTVRFSAYSDLTWELKDLDKKSALNYAELLVKEANQTGKQKWIAQGYNDIAIVQLRNGNLDKAMEALQKSLLLRRKLGNPRDIVSSLAKIGNIYVEQLKYTDAIKNFLEAAAISNREKMIVQEGMMYGNLSTVYYALNKYDLALGYARKALVINELSGNENGKGVCYSTIGGCFGDMGNYDSSVYYLNKSKAILFDLKEYNEYCTVVNNLGLMHRKFNRSEEGIKCYQEAIATAKAFGDTLGLTIYETNLAATLAKTGKLDESEAIYKSAMGISEKLGLNENLYKIYKGMVSLYIYKKDPGMAEYYFEKYNSLKDTVFSKDYAFQLSEIQTRYDVEKKDRALRENILELENERKENAFKSTVIISIVIVSLLSGLLLYTFLRNKRRREAEENERQAALMILETEQKERVRIARELHDSIGQKLTVLRMYAGENNTQTHLLNETIAEVRSLSHNMLPEILNLGFKPAVMDLANKVNAAGKIKCEVEVKERSDSYPDKDIQLSVYRIIQEIINNMLKHSRASLITIFLVNTEKELAVTIQDNGHGFDTKLIHASQGMGWGNILTRVKLINAKFDITSSDGGTNIRLTLNKKTHE